MIDIGLLFHMTLPMNPEFYQRKPVISCPSKTLKRTEIEDAQAGKLSSRQNLNFYMMCEKAKSKAKAMDFP